MNDIHPLKNPSARSVVVLGHPGHELAMFGLLQRHPPVAILIVSDGGPPERTAQSRRGFASIGLLDRVRYMGYPEKAFYQALLDGDAAFFQQIVGDLRTAFEELRPTEIVCDALEFYNPVHDITLPLVLAALGDGNAAVYELPLVYEMSGTVDEYRVQRVPQALAPRGFRFDLSQDEVSAKAAALDQIYLSLHKQAGPELLRIPLAELGREELYTTRVPLAVPAPAVERFATSDVRGCSTPRVVSAG